MNINELRQRLGDVKAEGRGVHDKIAALEAKADRSEAEEAELVALEKRADELMADVETAQADVSAEEARIERGRAFAAAPAADPRGATRPALDITSPEPDPAGTNGFADVAEFALAVRAGTPGGDGHWIDPRLGAAPSSPHQEGGTAEGFMVPSEFRDAIWEVVFGDEEFDLLNLVDLEPTSRNSVEHNADETTPWGSTGIQARWRGEASQMTESNLVTEPRQLGLNHLYAFVTASEELMEDTPRLASRLTNGAGQAIKWKASAGIFSGTGVGQPKGFHLSAAQVSVAKEGGQTADTVVAANVAKMFSRMLAGSIGRSSWLINSDVLPQIMTMTLGNNSIFMPPATGFQNAPGGFLLGRPILLTEHAKTVGDKGDIHLVDMRRGYHGLEKTGGVKFASSIHLYFDYGVEAFRWTFRMGGTPFLSAPVSPANGSNTKSHFVTLDARA